MLSSPLHFLLFHCDEDPFLVSYWACCVLPLSAQLLGDVVHPLHVSLYCCFLCFFCQTINILAFVSPDAPPDVPVCCCVCSLSCCFGCSGAALIQSIVWGGVGEGGFKVGRIYRLRRTGFLVFFLSLLFHVSFFFVSRLFSTFSPPT